MARALICPRNFVLVVTIVTFLKSFMIKGSGMTCDDKFKGKKCVLTNV